MKINEIVNSCVYFTFIFQRFCQSAKLINAILKTECTGNRTFNVMLVMKMYIAFLCFFGLS